MFHLQGILHFADIAAQAAQSYLQATEAFCWEGGPVRMVGLR